MSPSIAVGGTLEIPVFARIVKLAAVPRLTADVDGAPLSSLLESPSESVKSVVASPLSEVESPLTLASATVGAELAPDADPLASAEPDCADAFSSTFPHARPKKRKRLESVDG